MIRSLLRRALGVAPKATAPATARPSRPNPEPEPEEPQLEVDGPELLRWHRGGRSFLLLDVREASEVAHGHAAGSFLLPMNQVPQRVDELPAQGVTLVVVCAAGARSYGVAHWLREQGFADAWSLAGGVGAWIHEQPDAWRVPPRDAPFRPLQPVRVAAEVLKQAGLSTDEPLAGTVQEVAVQDGGPRFAVRVRPPTGGSWLLSDLPASALTPIGRAS